MAADRQLQAHDFRVFLGACAALFLASLYGPVMIIQPGFGDHTQLIAYLFPDMASARDFSLVSGIVLLAQKGTIVLSALLALFSVVLPIFKFVVCALGVDAFERRQPSNLLVSVVHTIGFFSMAEVVVIAVFAVTLKSIPGGTELQVGWAWWTYMFSVLGLSAITWKLHGLASPAAPEEHDPT